MAINPLLQATGVYREGYESIKVRKTRDSEGAAKSLRCYHVVTIGYFFTAAIFRMGEQNTQDSEKGVRLGSQGDRPEPELSRKSELSPHEQNAPEQARSKQRERRRLGNRRRSKKVGTKMGLRIFKCEPVHEVIGTRGGQAREQNWFRAPAKSRNMRTRSKGEVLVEKRAREYAFSVGPLEMGSYAVVGDPGKGEITEQALRRERHSRDCN